MACNCNSPSLPPPVTGLPTLLDLSGPPHCAGAAPAECCDECNDGEASTGTTLELAFTDARCARNDEGVTLLGRIGRRLMKLAGNGFIQLVDGKAFVVSSVPIVLRQLWHNYWVTGTSSVPVVGAPRNFPFGVVADSQGNIYGIQGLATADSVHVWNHTSNQWETLSLDKLPQSISRRLTGSVGIELVGYDPISVLNSPTVVRALKALSGQGIVYLTDVAVGVDDPAPGCEACEGSAFASVARVLTFPTIIPGEGETGRHQLVYSSEGLYWDPLV